MSKACSDCGLEIGHIEPEHAKEHEGLCCDCFDEGFGMPEENRSRPRIFPSTRVISEKDTELRAEARARLKARARAAKTKAMAARAAERKNKK